MATAKDIFRLMPSWFSRLPAIVIAASCTASGSSLFGRVQAAPPNAPKRADAAAPHARYVVMIVMENRSYARIIGNSDAPYINKELVPVAALMTDSHAVTHPSQPNYFALFSGSTQGVTDDSCPHRLEGPNVGQELLAARHSFAGYSESMPYDGFNGCYSREYARKHNPWVNFTQLPPRSNRVFNGFLTPPSALTVIVPNLCNDMHDCATETGDAWLSKHVPEILKYGAKHDGLFILTWDEAEPDANGQNRVPTLLAGPMITAGNYRTYVTHYSVLRTIEDVAGVPCTANACGASPLSGMWRSRAATLDAGKTRATRKRNVRRSR